MIQKFKANDLVTIIAGKYCGRSGTVTECIAIEHKGQVIAFEYFVNTREQGENGKQITNSIRIPEAHLS